MTNEEFEKRMGFILEQQAQFNAGMQRRREAQAHNGHLINRLVAVVKTKTGALAEAHSRLTEAQAHTDENLRNLIAVVDRYFNKGRNGKSEDKD